ncbi:tetratricopeptide repeat protein 36 isoform X1 [Ischnura elegans]|uniref:tetratricopeptide repeat protein 36 isoform X1 n=1 Tax=Ischnura elegans TaxID=197161 RepID=UPI001ED8B9EC|nr:tetratricopeptide repeat protein 36 isoform X1 [Ischnura elegans]
MKNSPKGMASKNDLAILNAIFDPLQAQDGRFGDEDVPSVDDDNEIETDIIREAKRIEVEGVKTAEQGQLQDAINIFTKAIDTAPNRPSGYNNRAQALRLFGKEADALVDLNNALNLCQKKGKVARQALCQRGMIYRKDGKDEEAKKDFEDAAALGSEFAKSQLVEMNPYAALCNKMLHDVFSKLQRGECD